VLNVLLIPRFGIEGAAIATGLASTLFNLMKFFYIWKKFGMQPYDKRTLETVLIIAISLLAGFFIPVPHNAWLAILERGSLIALIYGGLTLAFGIVPEYQHILTLGILRKK
jgi:O-antigen/teichoic acid export membrane protein